MYFGLLLIAITLEVYVLDSAMYFSDFLIYLAIYGIAIIITYALTYPYLVMLKKNDIVLRKGYVTLLLFHLPSFILFWFLVVSIFNSAIDVD